MKTLILVLGCAASVLAQITPPQPSAAPRASGDPIVLSPFVVDTTADQGYRASSSTSGSRLKTELKDIAASFTVLTNDFLDDLGATDIASAPGLVAGAENDQTTDPTRIGLNQGCLGDDFGDVNTRSGRSPRASAQSPSGKPFAWPPEHAEGRPIAIPSPLLPHSPTL